jgi:hypothetical protein
VTTLWSFRLYLARLLLGAGPEGYDFYFHRQVLDVRRQRGTAAREHWTQAARSIEYDGSEYIVDGVPVIT